MVAMRDGTRLNTFVFLPGSGGSRWPVILHRTPYGITASDARDKTDCTKAWLPSAAEPLRGSILRGWRNIVAHGYAAVYQDTRGRHGECDPHRNQLHLLRNGHRSGRRDQREQCGGREFDHDHGDIPHQFELQPPLARRIGHHRRGDR